MIDNIYRGKAVTQGRAAMRDLIRQYRLGRHLTEGMIRETAEWHGADPDEILRLFLNWVGADGVREDQG